MLFGFKIINPWLSFLDGMIAHQGNCWNVLFVQNVIEYLYHPYKVSKNHNFFIFISVSDQFDQLKDFLIRFNLLNILIESVVPR